MELYQKIHEEHPDNIESLQYLEALAKELGRSSEEYTKKLEKLRRNQPAAMQTSEWKSPPTSSRVQEWLIGGDYSQTLLPLRREEVNPSLRPRRRLPMRLLNEIADLEILALNGG